MLSKLSNPVVLALGANVPGVWGSVSAALQRAIQILAKQGFRHIQTSSVWKTKPVGSVRQPAYLNVVLKASTTHSPRQVLAVLKQLERRSGRRLGIHNGPRPLDIDLIDYGGCIVNWGLRHPRPKLVLPHPLMAERPFVIVPLAELDPGWRHPVLGLTARQLLTRAGGERRLMLRREISRVDSPPIPCD